MKKSNPKIIMDFLDAFLASGESKITAKQLIQETGVSSQNVNHIFQNLKNSGRYHIVPYVVKGNITTYRITHATKTMQLTHKVLASTDIVGAWRSIANNPDQRLYIPAFWQMGNTK